MIVLDSVDSTNEFLKRNHSVLENNSIVRARSQTSGKGRNGRSFHSPADSGLYMSLLLKGVHKSHTEFSACAAVAIVDVLKELFNISSSIKWVNDIYIDGRKLGGILCESSYMGNDLEYVIIGIGLNIFESNYPAELKGKITNLRNYTNKYIDIDVLACEIVNRLNYYLNHEEPLTYIKMYREYSCVLNREVIVEDRGNIYEAHVIEINDLGQLLVVDSNGCIHSLSSGEIHLKLKGNV